MKFRMVDTNILIRPVDEDEDSQIVVERDPNAPIRGEVKSWGNNIDDTSMSIVWFNPRDARPFQVEDEKWYIVKQEDLLAIEEDK